jgi:uncharacterized protein
MPVEVAQRGIRFVARNALALGRLEFEIAYHGGGEPTTPWDVLVDSHAYACELAREHGIRMRSAAASNGVPSDQQIDWVVSNLNGVSLSFDGLPEAATGTA